MELRVVLEAGDHVASQLGATISSVNHQHVHTGVSQRHGALPSVTPVTQGGTHHQTPGSILGGVGVLFSLNEVLDGDQTS